MHLRRSMLGRVVSSFDYKILVDLLSGSIPHAGKTFLLFFVALVSRSLTLF